MSCDVFLTNRWTVFGRETHRLNCHITECQDLDLCEVKNNIVQILVVLVLLSVIIDYRKEVVNIIALRKQRERKSLKVSWSYYQN